MRFLCIAALAALATAVPTANLKRHVLHERRATSVSWAKRERLHPEAELPMRIGLTQSNLHRADELLMEVSHPDSDKYGKYYTQEEVHDLFAPADESVAAVRTWLEEAGIAPHRISLSTNKQWIQFDAKVHEAEDLLNTKYHIFEHGQTAKGSIGCDEYHVHESVRSHVDYITPGIRLLGSSSLKKRTFSSDIVPTPPLLGLLPMPLASILAVPLLTICDLVITPPCIQAMYNFTPATSAQPGNELGVFEGLADYYDQTDLNLFFTTLEQRIPLGTHPTLKGIDGGTAPASVLQAGGESNLDFQISYPIIWPQNSILFQTDDPVYEANYTFAGFFNNFLDAIDGSYCSYSAFGETGNSPIDPPYPDPAPGGYKGNLQCGVYKPTNVITLSYGGQEADLPVNYQQRQCSEFMKLGLQGVSVVFASGDYGVAGPPKDDSANGCLAGGKVFSPGFPASCPHVTSVGATFLPLGGFAGTDQEIATLRFASGGGFSNTFPIPSYQADAVAAYYKTSDPPYPYYTSGPGFGGGIYNRTGRGYPDVSAVGDNVLVFSGIIPQPVGGTSAAAPTFASLLTRINDERLKAGKTTVGFVNPTLYGNPWALHDITRGSNPGCGTEGFKVSAGWDPVTGLGTPNYPELLKLFMSLP